MFDGLELDILTRSAKAQTLVLKVVLPPIEEIVLLLLLVDILPKVGETAKKRARQLDVVIWKWGRLLLPSFLDDCLAL